MRNRPIKPGFEKLQSIKTDLFNLRHKVSKMRKSIQWTLKNLENAISELKNEKARYPNGLINEIFKEGVAGTDLTVIEPENETSWNRAFSEKSCLQPKPSFGS